jgi:hypothetical protein
MANRSVIVSFITKLNSKGIQAAESGFKKLGKSALSAGKASKLGFLLSGTAAVAFASKQMAAALKATEEEDRALRQLEQTLKNVGSSFSVKEVSGFVDGLQKAFGVSENLLRPSLNQLITVTRDVASSQELLKIALDVSKGSGKDLASVTSALSRAYSGNLSALGKLNVGLDKSMLKSNDLDGAILDLSQRFSGQAATAAEGFAGQLDKLRISGEKAQKNLGVGLVEALKVLAGDRPGGMENLGGELENIGTRFGNVAIGFADFARDAKGIIKPVLAVIAVLTPLGRIVGVVGLALKLFEKRGAKVKAERDALKSTLDIENKRDQARAAQTQTTTKIVKLTASQLALQKKLQEQEKKTNAEKNKERAKKLEEERQAKVMSDLANKFDIEGINLAIAKRRAGTSEEIAAVEGLQAIRSEGYKDDEAALAKLMSLDKARAAAVAADVNQLNKLTIEIQLYYKSLGIPVPPGMMEGLGGQLPPPPAPKVATQAEIAAIVKEKASSEISQVIPSTSVQDLIDREMAIDKPFMPGDAGFTGTGFPSSMGGFDYLGVGAAGGTTINLNVAGSVLTEQDLGFYISNLIGNQNRQGNPVTLDLLGR